VLQHPATQGLVAAKSAQAACDLAREVLDFVRAHLPLVVLFGSLAKGRNVGRRA